MISAVSLGLRALQVLFGIVILGLAATLAKQQVFGHPPTTTTYSIFTGAFAVIAAAVGTIAMFMEAIPSVVPMGFDAVGGLLLLAGGIAWAVGLKGIQCTNQASGLDMLSNGLLNEGSTTADGAQVTGAEVNSQNADQLWNILSGNCQKGFADEIIQFLSFLLAMILIVLGFFAVKKGGSRPSFIA